MKFNKIILVSLFLLILTLGAVSASENVQDNITSTQDADILADDGDEDLFVEYEEGTGTVNPNLEVNWPSEIKVGEIYPVTFRNVPEDMETNVTLFVNSERIDDGQRADNYTPYDIFIDEIGTYNLKFKFYGDSKYAPVIKEKSYSVTDFKFDVAIPNEDITYGQEAQLMIEFPTDMTGSITVQGVNYAIGDSDTINATVKNLNIGTNQIPISYSGDEKYKAKSITVPVNVKAQVVYSKQMPFNKVVFSLTLPGNAVGDLEITVDDGIKETAKLTNGKAEIRFEGLELGNHTFRPNYTGNDYKCTNNENIQFEVTPEIIINSFKTSKDENSIQIRLPKGEYGVLNVVTHRYLEENAGMPIDETRDYLVSDGTLYLPTLDYGYYEFDVTYFSNTGYTFSKHEEDFIRDVISMNVTAPDKILADDGNIEINVDYLNTNDASIILYVDGKKYGEMECNGTGNLKFIVTDTLSAGTHTITAAFSGNDRYAPLEKLVSLESFNYFFNIPDGIVIGSDEEISINAVKDAGGYLAVYVNEELFKREKITNGKASINMASLPFQTFLIKVAYEGGKYPANTTQPKAMPVSYTFKMSEESLVYGGDSFYAIDLPSGLSSNKLTVKIDNVPYQLISKGDRIGIDVSGLSMGLHVISVTHPGEGIFYPLSIEKTIEVIGKINVSSQIKLGQGKVIYLILPQGPQGKLVLSKYNENSYNYDEFRSFDFAQYGNDAMAEIPISALDIGENIIKVSYSGNDYNVSSVFTQITINLDMAFNRQIQHGKKAVATINLPGARGAIDVYVDEDLIKEVSFVNGVARIEFSSDLEIGLHYFRFDYYADYTFSYEGEFIVYPGVTVPTSIIDASKSVVIKSGDEPVGSIIFYENGKKLKEIDVEENGQKMSLAFLEKGNRKVTLVYDSWDEATYTLGTFTINVKKASITAKDMSMSYLDGSKYKVQVKDYKGKAVGKGQTVKFYVDGKLFKTVKTDAKGYASVVLTHVPGKHTVKIVYKATTVTKKVTVKQILTLKKVKVKRSAKQLVLTATLKKVKGKFLKDKQIAFKFNGKTYKAKTNSKGVAKVTVPSKILKKLKAGKNVAYQATYVKATVKQSVKVQK